MSCRWGFIIAALCGLVGVAIAWSLPEELQESLPEESSLDLREKEQREEDVRGEVHDDQADQVSKLSADNACVFLPASRLDHD